MRNSQPIIKALAVTASISVASANSSAQDLTSRDLLILAAKNTLIEGCQSFEGFNADSINLESLDDLELQELIDHLNLSVESFCVYKELEFFEQGVERVSE